MSDDVETKVNEAIRRLFENTPSFQALQKYRPLVRRLSLEEYAGLRMAVEEDRERRLIEASNKFISR